MRRALTNGLLLLVSLAVVLVIAEFSVGRLVSIRDVGPSFTQFDPEYGKRLKPDFNTVRRTPEFVMSFTTNRFGFRGDDVDTLPEGSVLFLGDSFTMGYGVNDGEEYPALMRDHFRQKNPEDDYPIVNMGIGGSGNGRWLKFLDDYGTTVNPRLVVMQVMANDFADNAKEKLYVLNGDADLVELPIAEPSLQRKVQAVIEAVPGLASTNLVGLLRQVRGARGAPPDPTAEPVKMEKDPELDLTLAILSEAIEVCKENDWPVVALLVELTENRRTDVKSLFERNGIVVVESPTKVDDPEYYYRIDGHWNADGHAEVARLMIATFEEHRLAFAD